MTHTYIHRQELKLLKQGDEFFPYLSSGLFSSLISRLWNTSLFIWVFFCKFAFRVERIKRKERETSYSAVDHCMLRHDDTRHFELSSVLHLIKKKYWPMYSSSDIRSAKNSATLGKEANLTVAESNGWEGFPSIPKPHSLTNVIHGLCYFQNTAIVMMTIVCDTTDRLW